MSLEDMAVLFTGVRDATGELPEAAPTLTKKPMGREKDRYILLNLTKGKAVNPEDDPEETESFFADMFGRTRTEISDELISRDRLQNAVIEQRLMKMEQQLQEIKTILSSLVSKPVTVALSGLPGMSEATMPVQPGQDKTETVEIELENGAEKASNVMVPMACAGYGHEDRPGPENLFPTGTEVSKIAKWTSVGGQPQAVSRSKLACYFSEWKQD